MLFSSAICLFTVFFSAASALPFAEPLTPRASSLTVQTEGNGCPAGSFAASVASDNSAINIIFDKFVAGDGPNSKASGLSTRALCKITIGMTSPDWTVDLKSLDFRGFVALDQGVEASLVSRWKWIDARGNDMKGKGNVQQDLKGPFNDDVQLHLDNTEPSCQRKNAKIQITVSATVTSKNANANGIAHGSSQDFGFKNVANLSLKKC